MQHTPYTRQAETLLYSPRVPNEKEVLCACFREACMVGHSWTLPVLLKSPLFQRISQRELVAIFIEVLPSMQRNTRDTLYQSNCIDKRTKLLFMLAELNDGILRLLRLRS
jgi:hypothetical protein